MNNTFCRGAVAANTPLDLSFRAAIGWNQPTRFSPWIDSRVEVAVFVRGTHLGPGWDDRRPKNKASYLLGFPILRANKCIKKINWMSNKVLLLFLWLEQVGLDPQQFPAVPFAGDPCQATEYVPNSGASSNGWRCSANMSRASGMQMRFNQNIQ